ncbi:gag-Pol polyprotein/retrotransposon isoform X2 [Tasmannia lanceolata]|uniref:gag-Pol polyprotein/retrotransposon isoform X2 n=1 Tax=Tasmannia lanceolata TaxID=3420 RepID=UPI004062CAD8
MSFPLRVIGPRLSFSSFHDYSKFSPKCRISRVSIRFLFLNEKGFSIDQKNKPRRLCSMAGDGEAINVSDVHECSADHEGSKESSGRQSTKTFSSNELMKRLKRYGVSGVLSYGLLNTVYYLTTFLLVWFYVAPTPGRMGYAAAVQRKPGYQACQGRRGSSASTYCG